jgi:hypothetical protein
VVFYCIYYHDTHVRRIYLSKFAMLDIALLPSSRVALCFSATILAGEITQLSIVHRNKDVASHKGICYRLRQMRLPFRTA